MWFAARATLILMCCAALMTLACASDAGDEEVELVSKDAESVSVESVDVADMTETDMPDVVPASTDEPEAEGHGYARAKDAAFDFTKIKHRPLQRIGVGNIGGTPDQFGQQAAVGVDHKQGSLLGHFPVQGVRCFDCLPTTRQRQTDVEAGVVDHRLDFIKEVGGSPAQPFNQFFLLLAAG